LVSRNIASLEVASSFFEIGGDPVEANRLIVNLYNAGRDNQERFDTSTFEDLISTGRLGLISDVEVREAIQLAYKALGEVELALAPARTDEATIAARLREQGLDQARGMIEMTAAEVDHALDVLAN
jgi:hypothetical protein